MATFNLGYIASKCYIPTQLMTLRSLYDHFSRPNSRLSLKLCLYEDRETIDWDSIDLVIWSPDFDYISDYSGCLKLFDHLENIGVKSLNDYEVLKWNTDKNYLLELASRGITIPRTEVISKGDPIRSTLCKLMDESGSLVVKPVTGASGQNVLHFTKISDSVMEKVEELMALSDVLVQEYCPEIMTKGELSYIFIDNQFSHAVLKTNSKDFRVQIDHGGEVQTIEATKEKIEFCQNVLSKVPHQLSYARVDFLERNDQSLVVMELELFEPELIFCQQDIESGVLDKLEHAILKRLTNQN